MKYALEIIGRLQAQNKLLKDEVETLRKSAENSPPQSPLEAEVNYWRIEAEVDHARWLRTLEENESLRAELTNCKADYDRLLVYCNQLEEDIKEGKQP